MANKKLMLSQQLKFYQQTFWLAIIFLEHSLKLPNDLQSDLHHPLPLIHTLLPLSIK